MSATAYSYLAQASQTVAELVVRSRSEVRGSARINTPYPAVLQARGQIGQASHTVAAPQRQTLSLVRATAETWLYRGTEPIALRLERGLASRRVPWGILQGAVEVHDSELEVYTATAGSKAGEVVGLHLKNPKITVSLTALFRAGNPAPKRGQVFIWTAADGIPLRMLATKITHQWSAAGWREVAIEGVAYQGLLLPQS